MELKYTENLLKQKCENNAFDSYAIFVNKDGEEVFFHSDNVNEDTYFDIASMGKVLVTSTIALKTISDKKLSLDSTVGDFFENAPEDKKNITIQQLLTHMSGIERYGFPQKVADRGHEAVAEFILSTPLAFQPGTGQVYSCNGMILLGYILEKVYNAELEEIFEKLVKKPLGYTRSKFNIDLDEPNAAICYHTENVHGLEHPWDDDNVRILKTSAGSGGQFFTARDIRTFVKAVMARDERLYSRDIYDIAEREYVGNKGPEGRGLGWWYVDERFADTGKLFSKGSFGHTGYTGTCFFMNREKNMYVIMLTNSTRFLNKNNHWKGYDYDDTCKIRKDIHNAIYDDFVEQGLI